MTDALIFQSKLPLQNRGISISSPHDKTLCFNGEFSMKVIQSSTHSITVGLLTCQLIVTEFDPYNDTAA